MTTNERQYVIITPCRNEAEYLAATIRTVASQTIRPTLWVIVDDGSTDETPAILAKATRDHTFIEVVTRPDRGERAVGPGVIDTFYSGLDTINLDDFAYLCKLDADLEVPARYFQRLIEEMETEPRLGTFSGKVYLRDPDGSMSHERRGDENSVGPSKFYRVKCFRDIGGFERHVGWDGIDGHMCRLRNWMALSKDEPDLRLIHRRQMGSSDRSVYFGRVRGGIGKFYIGMSWWYILATAAYRIVDKPYLIGACCMLYGYLSAPWRGTKRFGDRAYLKSLRSFEWIALTRGKTTAINRRHEQIRLRHPDPRPRFGRHENSPKASIESNSAP